MKNYLGIGLLALISITGFSAGNEGEEKKDVPNTEGLSMDQAKVRGTPWFPGQPAFPVRNISDEEKQNIKDMIEEYLRE